MKAQSKAKAHFKISTKTKSHTANGPAVPVEYAKNMAVVQRASSRAMRVASRGR